MMQLNEAPLRLDIPVFCIAFLRSVRLQTSQRDTAMSDVLLFNVVKFKS